MYVFPGQFGILKQGGEQLQLVHAGSFVSEPTLGIAQNVVSFGIVSKDPCDHSGP